MNPHTPVIVGTGQVSQRKQDPREADEPLQLMLQASLAAGEDAGGGRQLLQQVQSVRVIKGWWRYGDPGRYLANTLSLPASTRTLGTPFGGNQVQSVINRTARELLAGDLQCALLTGAENGHSRARAKKAGLKLAQTNLPGAPDIVTGEEKDMSHPAETALGLRLAIQYYPLFENALRHARGESIPGHRRRIAELWSRFSAVAERNPHAWLPRFHDATTIATPDADNRPVSFPYPKLMNSNNAVDMGAALLMCSVSFAERQGIPREKWVFPLAGTEADDHYHVSHRDQLHTSPAIRLAGARLLELTGLEAADLELVDLYSCFPSAVQVAARELGLDETGTLTVTGGLTFGGGPLNNYVMHSVARMVELCRETPEQKGLISANGGFLTKHAFGIYSGTPPREDFAWANLQAEVDLLPRRACLAAHEGDATLESYAVMFGAAGPTVAHCACLTQAGDRTWVNTEDRELLDAMQEEEFCGRPLRLDGRGGLQVLG